MSPHVIDVDEATFPVEVLERSKTTPVVVDFWAAWCGPCRSLGPVLERLAGEADGSWVLARVDVDRNPRLAQAFGVQGIPAVHAFRDGRKVAEFVGALPEPQVREWLRQLGPTEAELALEAARAAESRGDLEAAADGYRDVLRHDLNNLEAKAALSRLETAARAASADPDALRARLEANPRDVEAAAALSDLDMASGRADEAFARLLDVVAATSGESRDEARGHLLRLLDQLPPDDPRSMAARRRLASILF